jgi:hypothetical protein
MAVTTTITDKSIESDTLTRDANSNTIVLKKDQIVLGKDNTISMSMLDGSNKLVDLGQVDAGDISVYRLEGGSLSVNENTDGDITIASNTAGDGTGQNGGIYVAYNGGDIAVDESDGSVLIGTLQGDNYITEFTGGTLSIEELDAATLSIADCTGATDIDLVQVQGKVTIGEIYGQKNTTALQVDKLTIGDIVIAEANNTTSRSNAKVKVNNPINCNIDIGYGCTTEDVYCDICENGKFRGKINLYNPRAAVIDIWNSNKESTDGNGTFVYLKGTTANTTVSFSHSSNCSIKDTSARATFGNMAFAADTSTHAKGYNLTTYKDTDQVYYFYGTSGYQYLVRATVGGVVRTGLFVWNTKQSSAKMTAAMIDGAFGSDDEAGIYTLVCEPMNLDGDVASSWGSSSGMRVYCNLAKPAWNTDTGAFANKGTNQTQTITALKAYKLPIHVTFTL